MCSLCNVGTISKYLNEACVTKCDKLMSEIFLMQRRGAIEHIAWKKNKAWPPFSVLYVTSNKKRETKTLINVLHIINSCRRRDLEKKHLSNIDYYTTSSSETSIYSPNCLQAYRRWKWWKAF